MSLTLVIGIVIGIICYKWIVAIFQFIAQGIYMAYMLCAMLGGGYWYYLFTIVPRDKAKGKIRSRSWKAFRKWIIEIDQGQYYKGD